MKNQFVTFLQPIQDGNTKSQFLGMVRCLVIGETCEVLSVKLLRKNRAYVGNLTHMREVLQGIHMANNTLHGYADIIVPIFHTVKASEFNTLFFGVKNNSAF